MKLQKKLPTPMLAHYHHWVYENHKTKSVETLRDWVIQETEFQTRVAETIQGFIGRSETRSTSKEAPYTFFESQIRALTQKCGQNIKFASYVVNKSQGIWICSEFYGDGDVKKVGTC